MAAAREVARSIPPSPFLSIPVFVTGPIALQLFSFSLGWVSRGPRRGSQFEDTCWPPCRCWPSPVAAPDRPGTARQGAEQCRGATLCRGTAGKRAEREPDRVRSSAEERIDSPPSPSWRSRSANCSRGSVITETIFNRTGIGYLTETAVRNQDTPIIQAVVITVSVTFVLINLIVDVLYPLIDPRIGKATKTQVVPA